MIDTVVGCRCSVAVKALPHDEIGPCSEWHTVVGEGVEVTPMSAVGTVGEVVAWAVFDESSPLFSVHYKGCKLPVVSSSEIPDGQPHKKAAKGSAPLPLSRHNRMKT